MFIAFKSLCYGTLLLPPTNYEFLGSRALWLAAHGSLKFFGYIFRGIILMKVKVGLLVAGVLALIVLQLGCQKSETSEITFSDHYIKVPIANNTVTAGYMTLVNETKRQIALTGVSISADIAEKAEIHGHAMRDGVMKMYKIDTLDLPPGQTVKLEPGGVHLMLMGLKKPIVPSTEIIVIFQFSGAEPVHISMPVTDA